MVGEDIRESQQTFTRLINSIIKDGLTSVILLSWLIILDVQLFILFIYCINSCRNCPTFNNKTLKRLSRQGLQFESNY